MESHAVAVETLDIRPVDTNNPLPLYHQVEAHLRELILGGVLKPMDVLPPELELCQHYQVGRHTMRTALSNLTNAQLIRRKAGLGTYVLPQRQRSEFYLDRSFTHQVRALGLTPSAHVLVLSRGIIDGHAPAVLAHLSGAPCWHLARLRLGDGTPMSLQYSTIIGAFCPDLAEYDMQHESLYHLLIDRHGIDIAQIRHTINAVSADEEQAQLLQVDEGTPLLLVKSTSYTKQHQIIEHTISYYRTDRYEYHTVHEFANSNDS